MEMEMSTVAPLLSEEVSNRNITDALGHGYNSPRPDSFVDGAAATAAGSGNNGSTPRPRRRSSGGFRASDQPAAEGRKSLLADKIEQISDSVKHEIGRKVVDAPLNTLSIRTRWDRLRYLLENKISAYALFPFLLLAVLTSIMIFGLGLSWHYLAREQVQSAAAEGGEMEIYGDSNWQDAIFMSLQLIISAGYDDR